MSRASIGAALLVTATLVAGCRERAATADQASVETTTADLGTQLRKVSDARESAKMKKIRDWVDGAVNNHGEFRKTARRHCTPGGDTGDPDNICQTLVIQGWAIESDDGDMELTDEGRRALKGATMSRSTVAFDVARRRVVEIGELTPVDDEERVYRFEFDWEWAPTEIGSALGIGGQTFTDSATVDSMSRRVTFETDFSNKLP